MQFYLKMLPYSPILIDYVFLNCESLSLYLFLQFVLCPGGLFNSATFFFPPINREQSPLATEERITVSVTPCGLPVNLTSVEDSV